VEYGRHCSLFSRQLTNKIHFKRFFFKKQSILYPIDQSFLSQQNISEYILYP